MFFFNWATRKFLITFATHMYGLCDVSVGSCWSRTLQTPCHLWAVVHASPSFWSIPLSPTSPQLIPYTVQVSEKMSPVGSALGSPGWVRGPFWASTTHRVSPMPALPPLSASPLSHLDQLWCQHFCVCLVFGLINPWAWGQSLSWSPHYLQSLAHSQWIYCINKWHVRCGSCTFCNWTVKPASEASFIVMALPPAQHLLLLRLLLGVR